MTYKTILLHADEGEGSGRLVAAAASVARRFGATLAGVGAVPMEAYVDAVVAEPQRDPMEWVDVDIGRRLAAAEDAFRRAADGVPVLWFGEAAYPDEAVAAHACAADLLVAPRPAGWCDLRKTVKPGDLLMSVGLPVLAVPPKAKPFAGEVVLVAWKRTREAERAISAALPFLRHAEDVAVVSAAEKGAVDRDADIEAVLGRLLRHGVAARRLDPPAFDGPTGAVLVKTAERIGADLIVSGAYGRSRALEWAFGGVTQHLLEHAPQFVLFSR
ncbi:MAG TPA: universal stress protein [Caulobacteraceae bacterium]|jgi:nucleotide-binding universal stress UspA family protein|nr:universal stress protein [Caulobacteraceae bacterium]